MPAIVDVELGGPGISGPYRCQIEHDGRTCVLYLGQVTLATVAKEAALSLFLRGAYGLAVDGALLDSRDRLTGDLAAELVAR